MIRSIGKSLALCAALTGAAALMQGAMAQTAPAPAAPAPAAAAPAAAADAPAADAAAPAPKPKRKVVKKPAAGAVAVKNNRTVALTVLNAAAEGGEPVKILGALAPGKQGTAHFPRGKDGKSCVFDLQGSYDDGSTTDSPGVDLCKNKTLNLVD